MSDIGTKRSIPLIQEAARLFKDIAPVEDVEPQGFVTRLARGPAGKGISPFAATRGAVWLPNEPASLRTALRDLLQRRLRDGWRLLPAAQLHECLVNH